jgi:hypothetical protein
VLLTPDRATVHGYLWLSRYSLMTAQEEVSVQQVIILSDDDELPICSIR